MAAPTLVSESAGSTTASAGTSHAITLPATVNAGDRLVAALAMHYNGTGCSFTWPAGWTELIDYSDDGWDFATTAAWRIADGTEDGGTVTVTSSQSEKATHKSWGFSGGGTVYAAVSGFDYGSNPNPPDLAPGIGAVDFHWIAIGGSQGDGTFSGYPSGYTGTGYIRTTGSWSEESGLGWGRKTSTASSENPGTFTFGGPANTIGITIGVAQSLVVPAILTVGTLSPGATVAVTYEGYAAVPLTANSTLGGVGITVSGATLSGCNIAVPAESAFLFGGSLAALRFDTNTTLVLANASETDSHTVQVTPASSDQLASRSAGSLINPLDNYNGQSVALNDDVYQYTISGPADSFTPHPANNLITPLELAFTWGSKWYDVSASSWSGLTSKDFPVADAPGGGTLEITSTLIAQNPLGTLTPTERSLTSFGGLDWLKTARLTTQTFDTKSGGSMIAAPANIGTPAWARSEGDSVGHPLVSWTNGAELGSHTGDRFYDYTTVNGAGQRFTISPAGALVKLYFLAGGYNAASFDVDVSFSDDSATPVTLRHTTAVDAHEQYLYEVTAHPVGGAATIEFDFTKVSGQLVAWQAIAIESGTSGSVYSLTSSDTTPTPGQTITATLVGGPFQGAITAAYAVFGEHQVPLSFSVLTPTTTSVTLPALGRFAQSRLAEYLPWYASFTLRLVAGAESADSENDNQLIAPSDDGSYVGYLAARALPSEISSAFVRTASAVDTSPAGVLSVVTAGNPAYDRYDGLILEAARTNLLTYSDDLSNAAWNYSRTSVSSNDTVSLDGGTNADTVIENTALATHEMGRSSSITLAADTSIVVSVLAKRNVGTRNFRVTLYTASHGLRATFNFDTLTTTNGSYGTATFTSATMEAAGNGWYWLTLIGKPSATETNPSFSGQLIQGTSTSSYTGDGVSGISLWRFGAEVGTFRSSSIQTTSAAVQRPAAYVGPVLLTDLGIASQTNEYSMAIAVKMLYSSSAEPATGFVYGGLAASGDANNRIYFQHSGGTGNTMRCAYTVAGAATSQTTAAQTWAKDDVVIFAFSKGATNGVIFRFNASVQTDGGATAKAAFGSAVAHASINTSPHGAGSHDAGVYQGFRIWDRALTQAELEALTAADVIPIGDYGTVGAPPWGPSASNNAQEGDKAYIETVSGAGLATPESFGWSQSQRSTARVYTFNTASGRWLSVRRIGATWSRPKLNVKVAVRRSVLRSVRSPY